LHTPETEGVKTEVEKEPVRNHVSHSFEVDPDLFGYARLLCDTSLAWEAKMGVKVDPDLEKRFLKTYHSGSTTSMLRAWMSMMGEASRRAKERP